MMSGGYGDRSRGRGSGAGDRWEEDLVKAMLLRTPRPVEERPLEFVELPAPVPGPGGLLIAVHACGICHTDLHTVEGELPPHRSPVVPGHQIVGEVVAVGEGVAAAFVGRRVGVPWLWCADGACRYCRRGDENLCERALFTGYDVDGGYAEYVVAPAAFSYPLPEAMDDLAVAPLLCAGIIGYRCLRLAGVIGERTLPGEERAPGESDEEVWDEAGLACCGMPGDAVTPPSVTVAEEGGGGGGEVRERPSRRLGLYGFGAAAHIATQIAVYVGWEVYVFTRGEEHRRLARELGAVWAGAAGEAAGDDAALRLDAAIVFAPAGGLVIDALKAVDKGGIVALGGIYSSPIPAIDYPLIYHERVLRSVTNSTRRDAEELLRVAAEIPVHTEVQVFPLEAANEALLALKESRIRGAGVLRIG
jgi:alcohol dehydrogenase, propanol-preferring